MTLALMSHDAWQPGRSSACSTSTGLEELATADGRCRPVSDSGVLHPGVAIRRPRRRGRRGMGWRPDERRPPARSHRGSAGRVDLRLYALSLIHISEPTRLLSISYA